MRAPYTQLYVHLIWSTRDRLELISEAIERPLRAAIAAKCQELKCDLVAIGGVPDHIHLLVRLHPAVSISELVKQVKGSSSHLITHKINPDGFFKWQGAYRAFTVRKADAPRVMKYIEHQKAHHAEKTINKDWEITGSDE
ncbi:MAG TPA: IS200/IS605 family transposase [Anaerolineales bacterium]|nr:IS200/IS605 family transposase [Anaerolineales bacterium]